MTLLLLLGHLLPSTQFFSAPSTYLPVHSLLEFIAMAVAAMVCSLAWSLRREGLNSQRLLLGACFLAVCLVDFAHMLSYAGMPPLVTPSGAEKAINFWLAARFLAATGLLAVAILPAVRWTPCAAYLVFAAALALSMLIWWLGLWQADLLPRTFIPGQGLTPFKIGAEYLVAALYAAGAVLLYRQSRRSGSRQQKYLAAAAWIQGLAELFFTLYANVSDLFNLLGHLYKVVAYCLVYRAVFAEGVRAPYRELGFERAQLRTLLASIPDPIWLKDSGGNYLSCNPAFERLYGVPEAAMLGRSDYQFVSHAQADFFRAKDQAAIAAGGPSVNEEWLTFAADGYHGLFETTKTPMYATDGKLIGVLGIAHDITEHKRAEQRLRDSEQHYRTLADSGSVLIWTSDLDLGCDYFNAPWLQFTGRTLQQELGEGWTEGVHPDDLARCLKTYREAFARRDRFSLEYRLRHADGSYRWLRDDGTPRYDSQGAFLGYIGYCWDMTAHKAADEAIQRLAFYDPLTQLPNRRLVLDRLEHALGLSARRSRYGALMMLDLDNFKSLNDTQGHAVGDQLLVEVARRLSTCVRESDTVSRLGGDEFVVLLHDLDQTLLAATQAEQVADKILARLGEPYRLEIGLGEHTAGTRDYHCTASIGIALFQGRAISTEELMKRVDAAMYQAKAAGRNTLRFFDPALQASIEAQAATEAELRAAIEAQQLVLHYQPQVGTDGRILGAEALVRWQVQGGQLVLPGEFIALAERTGLILPLGLWVLEAACRQLARWAGNEATARLTLAVNVSSRQFSHPAFVEQVLERVERYAVPASRLKLELTESLLLENAEEVVAKMLTLKARGLSFSLDDFGTGYSSLAYLKRLPLDQLKIDQSFVRDILHDSNDATIARTVLVLGQSLGLEVIAEGVETAAQRDCLAAAGCRAFQGYLFSRPLPLPAFESLLQHGAACASHAAPACPAVPLPA